MGSIARGRPRIRAWFPLLLAVVVALPPGAPGQEGGVGELAIRRGAANTAAARRLVAFGNWCTARHLRVLAREQYEAALKFEPDEEEARVALGYRREGNRWSGPGVREALFDAPIPQASFLAAVERESDAAHGAGAAAFADLAGWCDAEGLETYAREAWWTVLWFDPAHRAAREALRWTGADPAWAGPSDDGPLQFERICKQAGEMANREVAAALGKNPTSVDTVDVPEGTESRESVYTVRTTQKEAPSSLVLREILQTEAFWRGLGVLGPRTGGEVCFNFLAVESREDYLARVRDWPGLAEEDRERHLKSGGCWIDDVSFLTYGSGGRVREDAVHYATHHLLGLLSTGRAPRWIYEGSAVFAATVLRGEANSYCVSIGNSATGRDAPGRRDWNGTVRESIRRGEDPPIMELMAARTNDLALPALLKSRSIAMWLVVRSPATFRAVFEAAKKKVAPTDVLGAALGCPPEAMERHWRLWALRP